MLSWQTQLSGIEKYFSNAASVFSTGAVLFSFCLPNNFAANHRQQNFRVTNVIRRTFQNVAIDHNQIGKFARLQRTFLFLFEIQIRVVDAYKNESPVRESSRLHGLSTPPRSVCRVSAIQIPSHGFQGFVLSMESNCTM